MSQPDDQTYDDSGRPVQSVDFEFPDDEPAQAERGVDAGQLAEFARRIILVALAGKTPLAVERRLKVIAWLTCPSLTGIKNKAQLSRLLGLSRPGCGKLVYKVSQELREKPHVSASRG